MHYRVCEVHMLKVVTQSTLITNAFHYIMKYSDLITNSVNAVAYKMSISSLSQKMKKVQ